MVLLFVTVAVVLVLIVMTSRAQASDDRSIGAPSMTRVRFPVKLAALASTDVPAVGQPGSWFDPRTDSRLKRWWKHRWVLYPGAVGSGWGLKLRFRF